MKAELTRRLLEARATGRPIELLTDDFDFGEEVAYDVQDLVVEHLCGGGADVRAGYKIAMTSPETMALAGASEPVYGVLLTSMVLRSPADLRVADLGQGRVEAELIFLVDRDLPAGAGAGEILRSCRIAAGLELPSARYRDWFGRMRVPDLAADNAAAARLVVGADGVPATSLQLDRIEGVVRQDGVEIARAPSSIVLGNPLNALEWLVRRLARRGRWLRAGEIVSSGTFHLPPEIVRGRYEAHFAGVGTVSATFK